MLCYKKLLINYFVVSEKAVALIIYDQSVFIMYNDSYLVKQETKGQKFFRLLVIKCRCKYDWKFKLDIEIFIAEPKSSLIWLKLETTLCQISTAKCADSNANTYHNKYDKPLKSC